MFPIGSTYSARKDIAMLVNETSKINIPSNPNVVNRNSRHGREAMAREVWSLKHFFT